MKLHLSQFVGTETKHHTKMRLNSNSIEKAKEIELQWDGIV